MKRSLQLLLIILLPFFLNAGSARIEVSLGPSIPVCSFMTAGSGTINVDLDGKVSAGTAASVAVFHRFSTWLSAGGVLMGDVRELVENPGAFISVPLMGAIRFSYEKEDMALPLTIMAGGHMQISGATLKAGPAFAASAGLALRLTDSLFFDVSTWITLLMQFSDDGRIAYQLVSRPVALGIRAEF